MKAIVSLADPSSPTGYAEAGNFARTIVEGPSIDTLTIRARAFALGRCFRIEVHTGRTASIFTQATSVFVSDSKGLMTAYKG